MSVEITIKVRKTTDNGSIEKDRMYTLDTLLCLSQGHFQLWNDLMKMVEAVEEENVNYQPGDHA